MRSAAMPGMPGAPLDAPFGAPLLAELGAEGPGARVAALLDEVHSLAHTIASARSEIQELALDEISSNHIPTATDELDAIVEHTAAATETILEACETVDAAAAALTGEWSDKLQAATTSIYEACSFQDITGQRIRKVVGALKTIDEKVAAMLDRFGITDAVVQPACRMGTGDTPSGVAHDGQAALLNGPQLPQSAMGQSEIDELLASFG